MNEHPEIAEVDWIDDAFYISETQVWIVYQCAEEW